VTAALGHGVVVDPDEVVHPDRHPVDQAVRLDGCLFRVGLAAEDQPVVFRPLRRMLRVLPQHVGEQRFQVGVGLALLLDLTERLLCLRPIERQDADRDLAASVARLRVLAVARNDVLQRQAEGNDVLL
jgi:hypothetical protein